MKNVFRSSMAALAGIALLSALTACDDDKSATLPSPAAPPAVVPYPLDSTLRLNQIQVLGSHNSYHSGPVMAGDDLDGIFANNLIAGYLRPLLNYRHPTLTQQLALGVRQFELDVWADPAGGAYQLATAAASGAVPAFSFDRSVEHPDLLSAGLKVMHIANIDPYSSCISLQSCLQEIKTWSDANPGHVPLMIMVEIKDQNSLTDTFNAAPGLQTWVASDYDALDAEIRAVFPAEKIITPDDVQGTHASLNEAVLAGEWPTLAQSRGKVLFTNCACLTDRHRTDYLQADGSLSGRVMFTNSSGMADGSPANAFYVVDDPEADASTINTLVTAGYLVRTQADAYGQKNEVRRDAAFASGVQFVSTDFEQTHALNSDPIYQIAVPAGAPARCNPLTVSVACTARDIESPDALAQP
ncbi:MAG: Ca2+-dependent phosphoinositide-specific phospholipase C [Moraxellaceae bacterium]